MSSIQHSAATLDVWKNQHRVQHPTGGIVWVEGHSTPEQLADGSILWHGYAQDITACKLSEDLLEQQQKQLRLRNRALKQFNYAVSHELKTPLVTIESSLGLLQESLPQKMDAELDSGFEHARNAARKMNQLLESLLLMFRIDTADSVAGTIEFSSLVQGVVDDLTKENRLQGIKVTIATQGPILNGDRDNLVKIWQHLIENAARYMGGQKNPTIDIGFERTAQEVLFFVRDNGSGIEEQYQERVFGLFDQLDKASAGHGLGLTLVKRIVEFYDGAIDVESAGAKQGSCFYFTLPDALAQEDTAL